MHAPPSLAGDVSGSSTDGVSDSGHSRAENCASVARQPHSIHIAFAVLFGSFRMLPTSRCGSATSLLPRTYLALSNCFDCSTTRAVQCEEFDGDRMYTVIASTVLLLSIGHPDRSRDGWLPLRLEIDPGKGDLRRRHMALIGGTTMGMLSRRR
jgi:hypothetical protein